MDKGWKLALATILISLIVWLPFKFDWNNMLGYQLDLGGGIQKIWSSFDGTYYLTIARSWYDKEVIRTQYSTNVPLEYYPAHLPMYPAIISVFDLFLAGPWAMLVAALAGWVLAALMFGKTAKQWGIKLSWWLCLAFLILPPRAMAIRAVGSPEGWFIFFILASLYCFVGKKYWLSGLAGAGALLTKSPGILLFVGYGVYLVYEWFKSKKIEWKAWPLLLIPAAGVGLFFFYKITIGDFWAYFKSGDNIHLFWPPFAIFTARGQAWVGDFWLEEIVWTYAIYGGLVIAWWLKQKSAASWFSLIFFVSTLMVAHKDLGRYILPIFPLLLLANAEITKQRWFRIVLILLIVPTYLFTLSFLAKNYLPIADWAPYL